MSQDHIRTQTHEVDAFLWFDEHGLSPYWAIRSILIHEFDGYKKITAEIDDELWSVELAYSDSGIAPRPSDTIERDVLRDWELHLEGPHQAKAHFQIRARYDDMRGPDGEVRSIPWCGGEGLDVHVGSSNVELDRVVPLLQNALDALFQEAGDSVNPSYFQNPRGDSNIVTLEQYVRITRDYAMKLVQSDGIMYRIMHLLADKEGTEWVYSADNTDIVGHRHAFDLDPTSVSDLISDHSLGKRAKLYHPKYVRERETDDDPLSSPKLGVAFHKSIDGDARNWADRRDLVRELEETVINMLDWAGIPSTADPSAFVPDNHFELDESERKIGRFSDPTPRLEAEQETVMMSVISELTPSGQDIVQELATDGGEVHYEELAAETNSSISTIYRVIDQLGDAVESDYGRVRFTSEKIRQEIVGMVTRLEELMGSTAERMADLANVELRSASSSALDQWMAKYGAEILDHGDFGGGTIRFDTILSNAKTLQEPSIYDVLEEGLKAWTSTGRDPRWFKQLSWNAREVRGLDYDEGKVARTLPR